MIDLFGVSAEIISLILGIVTCLWIASRASSDLVVLKAALLAVLYVIAAALVAVAAISPNNTGFSTINKIPDLITEFLGRGVFALFATSALVVTSSISLTGTEIAESELITWATRAVSIMLVVLISMLVLLGNAVPTWLY